MTQNSPRDVPTSNGIQISEYVQEFLYAYHDSHLVRIGTIIATLAIFGLAVGLTVLWGALGLLIFIGLIVAVMPFLAILQLLSQNHL